MELQAGSTIQITNEAHHWFPAVLIVEEVRPWGCVAYAHILSNDPGPCDQRAFIRLKREDFNVVGQASIIAA